MQWAFGEPIAWRLAIRCYGPALLSLANRKTQTGSRRELGRIANAFSPAGMTYRAYRRGEANATQNMAMSLFNRLHTLDEKGRARATPKPWQGQNRSKPVDPTTSPADCTASDPIAATAVVHAALRIGIARQQRRRHRPAFEALAVQPHLATLDRDLVAGQADDALDIVGRMARRSPAADPKMSSCSAARCAGRAGSRAGQGRHRRRRSSGAGPMRHR